MANGESIGGPEAAPAGRLSSVALQAWFAEQIAAAAGIAPDEVDPEASFRDLGLSSRALVSLHGALEDRLGRTVPAEVVWEHGSPARLARFLGGDSAAGARGVSAAGHGPAAADGAGPHGPHAGPVAEPIAVVGIGLRLPGGVDSPDGFWRLLCDGADAVRETPPERWSLDAEAVRRAGADPAACRWGALLERVDEFDAGFFGISPREAVAMDPQQRLLLEVAWEAIDRAAVPLDRLRTGRTGVFVGIANYDYGRMQDAEGAGIGAYTSTGSALSIAANRLSYAFDLRGPSLSVDTACSSSLVAVHLAAQSLRNRESDAVLVGGVSLALSPVIGLNYGLLGGISPTGRCRAFDADADGIVRGEGVAVVLLERLSDAVRHGDPVIAVLRGSAINQDGRTNGLTAPSAAAQADVVRSAWREAGVTPADVGLVETHGPGTRLGDPIEVAALAEVFGDEGVRCALGSVKTNMGHLEAAAGLVGLVKAALCVQRGRIPGNLHFRRPNPRIPLEGTPFFVPTAVTDWPAAFPRRVAGVSSFGFGGTNAHVVVANAETPQVPADPDPADGRPHVLVASARDAGALARSARRLAETVELEASLGDLCFTAARRRTHLEHRLAVAGHSREELAAGLRAFADGGHPAGVRAGLARGVAPMVAWCFAGYAGDPGEAGRALYAVPGPFRDTIDQVAPLIAEEAGFDVRDILRERATAPEDRLDVLLPAAFAVQVALAAWWRSAGVTPDAVVGHSAGEVAAAYVAGALDLPDATRVICRRARLLQTLTGRGAMMAVDLPYERALRDSGGGLAIAVDAAPGQVVVSGPDEALAALGERCEAEGVRFRRLTTRVAGHSELVEPILAELGEQLSGITPRTPAVPFVSTVDTGVWNPVADTAYWLRNLRRTVHFRPAVEDLAARGFGVFLEISTHPVLVHSIDRTLPAGGSARPAVLSSVRRDVPSWESLLATLAELHCRGVAVDWSARYPRGEIVPLPSYPWQHRPYWFTPQERSPAGPASAATAAPEPAGSPGSSAATRPPASPPGQYSVTWHPAPPPAAPAARDDGWLVLSDDGPYGTAVVVELARRGRRCLLVRPDRLDEHVLRRLREGEQPWLVVDLRALTDTQEDHETIPPDLAERRLARTTALVAGLTAAGLGDRARAWWVTRGAQPVSGRGEPVDVASAALWSLARTVRLEHPGLWGGLLDVGADDPALVARCLADELLAAGPEDEVAYREGRRFVARLTAAEPARPGAAPDADPEGAYLVCGGLGRLGTEVARWLAGRGARHLVLTGRTGPGPRHQAGLRALADLGVEVTTVRADVADEAAMTALFERFGRDLPPLREVYHLATSRGIGRLATTRAEDAHARLAAKVRGGWLLHRLCDGRGVSRLVFFSSAVACLGWRSGGHYAAANGFLDALAHERTRAGEPTLSVGWGAWDMPDSPDVDLVGDDGFRLMPPGDCLAILGSLLTGDATHRAVAAVDWPVLAGAYRSGRAVPVLDTVAGAARPATAEPRAAEPAEGSPAPVRDDGVRAAAPQAAAPQAATPRAAVPGGADGTPEAQAAPRPDAVDAVNALNALNALNDVDGMRGMLRAELAAVLRVEDPAEIDPRVGLFELGLDSVMSVELRARIERRLGREVPPTLVFEFPTIEELAVALSGDTAGDVAGNTAGGVAGITAGGVAGDMAGQPAPFSARPVPAGRPGSAGGDGGPAAAAGAPLRADLPSPADPPHAAEAEAAPYGHDPLEEQDELIRRLAEKLELLR
ncbi:acyltransferase domain-containing protein [Microbispora cellulosiformans]|uniref:Acyltransferase domain-containing protein n=1 Tax=Microbispora cellulosiformans TaxID=2614688 RepID=A0A5J5K2W2_9ACTN|nr:type I polyketide synthase [Microbispora cellulosiformans]KAA9377579.1 acyltransferase domain-containing protein [Microbispora cellulosiformans]